MAGKGGGGGGWREEGGGGRGDRREGRERNKTKSGCILNVSRYHAGCSKARVIRITAQRGQGGGWVSMHAAYRKTGRAVLSWSGAAATEPVSGQSRSSLCQTPPLSATTQTNGTRELYNYGIHCSQTTRRVFQC